MQKLFKRLGESGTYGGIAAILYGLNELFKIKELEPVITAAQSAADAATVTGSPMMAIGALVAGVIAVFVPEKGNK